MDYFITPRHISANVHEAALCILRYACYLYRKTSTFDNTLDYYGLELSDWELHELASYLEYLEHGLRTQS